jgi:hypothetical protein
LLVGAIGGTRGTPQPPVIGAITPGKFTRLKVTLAARDWIVDLATIAF